jgi:hypothetical protein
LLFLGQSKLLASPDSRGRESLLIDEEWHACIGMWRIMGDHLGIYTLEYLIMFTDG